MTRINIYPYAGFKNEEVDAVIVDNQVIYKYDNGIQGFSSIGKIPSSIISLIQKLSWGSRLKDNEVLRRVIMTNLCLNKLYTLTL